MDIFEKVRADNQARRDRRRNCTHDEWEEVEEEPGEFYAQCATCLAQWRVDDEEPTSG